MSWTWADADPFIWVIETSFDGMGGWAVFDSTAGVNREYDDSGLAGMFVRIIGHDVDDNPVTPYSNVVQPM